MKKIWKKQFCILLCLFLTCTNLYVGNVSWVYAQNEREGGSPDASPETASPYDEVYVIDDNDIAMEDTDERKGFCSIAYSDGWTAEVGGGGTGCFNNTDHWTETPGATCTVTFVGTNLKFYTRTANFFACADFSVDGEEPVEIDFYSPSQTDNVFLFDTGILEYGEHTLNITVKEKEGRKVIVMDRVEVSCPYRIVNDADEGEGAFKVVYAGGWQHQSSQTQAPEGCTHHAVTPKELSYQKDAHWVGGSGSLTLQFYGTSVKYYTESQNGVVDVYIDDMENPAASGISMSTGTPNQGLAFDSSNYAALSPGLHTLKVEVSSGIVVADRMEVCCSHKEEGTVLKNEKEAACTKEGYSGDTHYQYCGQKISDGAAIPAKGHSWDEGEVTKQPTESEDGVKTYTCTACQTTRTETVSYSCSHENKQERHQAPTCTQEGFSDAYYCPDCEKMISEGTVIPALGHDLEIRDAKEASATEDGYTGDTYCTRCDEYFIKGEVISKAYAVVNDSVTGTGNLEFNFDEGWTYEKAASSAACYEGDNHWSDTQDAVLTFKFTGTSVKYFGQKAANLGYAAFSIDDGDEEEVNMYQAAKEEQVLIYKSKELPLGEHTLKVRVTGKNGAGNAPVVVADRIEVYCNHKGEEIESHDTEATCTEPACVGSKYGKVCGQKISDGEVRGEALGHEEETQEGKAATCTEDGYTEQTYCARCEQVIVKSETIPAPGHTEQTREKAATCTQPGYSGQIYCTVCDEIFDQGEEIEALGHQWNAGVVTIEPTETTEGEKTFTCIREGCGETMTVKLPAGGADACRHEHTEIRNQEATCTEAGYMGALYCEDCQMIILEGTVTDALGHEQEVRDKVEASGTEDGYTGDIYCKRCGERLESGKVIPKAYAVVNNAAVGNEELKFDFSEGWTYEKADSSVGCYEDDNHWSDTEDAVLTFRFKGTSVKYFGQKAANLGYAAFSIDDGEEEEVNLYQADKENNVLVYESENLEPGLHTLKVRVTGKKGEGNGNVVVADRIEVYCNHEGEESEERNTATCTEAGNIETYGLVCGQMISVEESVSALGHDERLRGEKAATCTEAGSTGEKYCARCGEVLEAGREIAALGHQWDEGVITKQPTTAETGTKTFSCAVCGETRTETLPRIAAPDTPKKGDQVTDASSKAKYKVLTIKASNGKMTGTVAYVKSSESSAKTVRIPANITVNGVTYTVTAIADKAFRNNKKITKVTIGSNVTTIGASAFSGCKKLKTVAIGKKVTIIGTSAFSKCTALTKITVPNKVKSIGKQAFSGCKKLKTITVKTTKLKKSTVGSNAFKGIYAKAAIKVPKSKLKSYQSILKARGAGKKVKIKKV